MNKTFTMDDVQIMYEDNSIIVVNKPQNMPSQSDETGDTDLLSLLKEYVKVKYNKAGEAYVGLVHRLDRPTGGVMVFARNSKCAARLCEQIKDGTMEKTYYTVLVGAPRDAKGTLVTYLKKNSLTNVVYVATSGTVDAKRAELSYKVLENFHDVVSLV
ncbi:MAG: pseudouridine synthase, partial [Clostridia bacterium]